MDMEAKIDKLENILKKYDSLEVVQYLAFWLTRINERHSHPFFKNLLSPYKQLHYVASLALKINSKGDKIISDNDWYTISKILQSIEEDYNKVIPEDFLFTNQEIINKKAVSQSAFINYFFQGTLSFQEQLIERIEKTFTKYDSTIKKEINFSVKELISFVELLSDEVNAKLNLIIKFQKNGEWKEFTNKMDRLNIPLNEWSNHFDNDINSAFNVLFKPESILTIDIENLNISCDKNKLKCFLDLFSVTNIEQSKYLYYGEKLPLEINPIVKLSLNKYLVFYQNELLTAIYDRLVVICREIIGKKFYKHRDKETESKVVDIFNLLFNNKKAKIFTSYSIDTHSEQDILIIHNSIAYIIEVKAGTFRQPMRDPLLAYNKIKSDFKAIVQEAYSQCLRVEDAFDESSEVKIYDKNAKLIDTIRTDKIRNTYSIIVTLDRLGQVQSDLSHLLKIEDDLPFPWSINIDDLECFLLMLKKKKNPQHKLEVFLSGRELLHGRLMTNDEIDVCCWYLRNEKEFVKSCKFSHHFIRANPKESNMLDKTYYSRGGLGFENERYIEEKNEGKTLFMGAPK